MNALAVTSAVAVLAVTASCMRPVRPGRTTTTVSPPATTPAPGGEPGSSQKGPNPTPASLTASRGPFATATASASGGTGFGGGTIHYPTDTSQGPYGVVAVVPGLTNPGSVMSPYGARLASHGFVVLIANTNTTSDSSSSRATQLLAALDWLTTRSSVANRIDASRQAVMGFSLGGGGALEAARQRGTLRATIPMAPFHNATSFSSVSVPTMIVACASDSIASPARLARPMYDSLSGPKAYSEISGSHACALTSTAAIGTRAIVWLKRYVDGDTRYHQFLCPQPITVSGATNWQSANVC